MSDLFPNLHWRALRGDIYGGITTAVVALPLCLAFGVASGLGPAAGLYSAILLGFFAALCGGAPAQISGPNGPMTVVMASVVAQFPDRPEMCFAAVILAGFFLVVGGLLRLGRYIALVPYPVISGFMTGVGLIIIILQLATLSGHSSFANIAGVIYHLPEYWLTPNWQAVSIGLIALWIVVFTPKKLSAIIPSPLIALLLGTALAAWFFPLAPQIGALPSALPVPQWPMISLGDWQQLVLPALMLAGLAAIDSLMTATVADGMLRGKHDSNRELVGQGIGNFMAGLFGGIAGSGATMRTTVNIRAGGRTPISGMLHAFLLLAILAGLGSLAEHIPHAVLAGILLKVGFDIIDWRFVRKIPNLPPFKAALMLLVVLLTLWADLMIAVLAGTVLAALALAKDMADHQLANMQKIDADALLPELPRDLAETWARISSTTLLYQLSGPLSYGATGQLAQRLLQIGGYQRLWLDMRAVSYIDTSSMIAIEDIVAAAKDQGLELAIIGLAAEQRIKLARLKIGLEPANFHASFTEALST
jgi:SulP family sulfate permease